MKKFKFALMILIIASLFTGCTTTLRINNYSNYKLDFVSWTDNQGKVYWFGNTMVYDYELATFVLGLGISGVDRQNVEPGCCPIYFYFASGGPYYHTSEVVTVDKWEKVTFTFWNDTLIELAGASTKGLQETMDTMDKTLSEDDFGRLKKYNYIKKLSSHSP